MEKGRIREVAQHLGERARDAFLEVPASVRAAGLVFFSGVLHGATFGAVEQGPAVAGAVGERAEDLAHEGAYILEEQNFRLRQDIARERDFERFIQGRDQLAQLDLERIADRVSMLGIISFHEQFVEAIPNEAHQQGERKMLSLIEHFKTLKHDGVPTEKILRSMLAYQGEQEDDQHSMYRLVVEGKGSCQSRAKLMTTLIYEVFPEWKHENVVQLQVFSGFIDGMGETHSGHVRAILEWKGGKRSILEGDMADLATDPYADSVSLNALHVFTVSTLQSVGLAPVFGAQGEVLAESLTPEQSGFFAKRQPWRPHGMQFPPGKDVWVGSGKDAASEQAERKEAPYGQALSVAILDEEEFGVQAAKKRFFQKNITPFQDVIDRYESLGARFEKSTRRAVREHAKSMLLYVPIDAEPQVVADIRAAYDALQKALYDAKSSDRIDVVFTVTNPDRVPSADVLTPWKPVEEQTKSDIRAVYYTYEILGLSEAGIAELQQREPGKVLVYQDDRQRIVARVIPDTSLLNAHDITSAEGLVIPPGVKALYLDGLTSTEGLVIPPGVDALGLNGLTSTEGLVIPPEVTILRLNGLTSAEGLVIPSEIKWLGLNGLTSAEGLVIPPGVKTLDLDGLASAEGLVIPPGILELDLSSLTSAEGLVIPSEIKWLDLDGLTSAEGLVIPPGVERLWLRSLTSAEGLVIPPGILELDLNGLTSAEGLVVPPGVERLWLSSLTSAEGLVIPPGVEELGLNGLTSAEGLVIPPNTNHVYLRGLDTLNGSNIPSKVQYYFSDAMLREWKRVHNK